MIEKSKHSLRTIFPNTTLKALSFGLMVSQSAKLSVLILDLNGGANNAQ